MKAPALKKLLYKTFGHLDNAQLLALTIYGEARGETDKGKIAVGSVILERVAHRDWDGKTVKDVCLKPFQFSCFLPTDSNFPLLKTIAADMEEYQNDNLALRACLDIAGGLLAGQIPEHAAIKKARCCQYLTPAAKNSVDWWKTMKHVATVGHHEFYA